MVEFGCLLFQYQFRGPIISYINDVCDNTNDEFNTQNDNNAYSNKDSNDICGANINDIFNTDNDNDSNNIYT